MAEDPPKLTIAASNDDAELAKQRAIDDLRWPLREMAANLLRVTRGAGKPHLVPQQIIDLSELILEASKFSNAWGIWTVFEEELQSGLPDWLAEDRHDGGEHTIIRGALQFVASELVYQSTQRAAGRSEMSDGIRQIETARERNRERMRAEQAAYRAALKLKKPKPKPKKKLTDAPRSETTADFMRKRPREIGKDT